MKLLLDFLPLILFFGTFKFAESHQEAAASFATEHFGFMVASAHVNTAVAPVLLATLVVMAATLIQALVLKLRRQKIDLMLWISLALVVVLGAATVWFQNETFIKWKPSGLYWAMSLVFFFSQALFGKNLLQAMLGKELELPAPVWRRLNLAWVLFFALMGMLNLYVAYNYSTSTWANFKVFGTTGLMLIFTLGQGLYMSRYLSDAEPAGKAEDKEKQP